MTEPGTGSDLQAIRTRADKREGSYVIGGSMTFITSGFLAGVVLVVAKTDPMQAARGTSIVIVETEGCDGYGYMNEYMVSHMYADARVRRIYGGANEIMKEVIARAL